MVIFHSYVKLPEGSSIMFNLIFVFLSLGASHDTTKILRPFPCHSQDEVETSFGWEQAAPGLWGGVFSSLIQIWFL
jgi:hypothetical protein